MSAIVNNAKQGVSGMGSSIAKGDIAGTFGNSLGIAFGQGTANAVSKISSKIGNQVIADTKGTVMAPIAGIKTLVNGGSLGDAAGTAFHSAFDPGIALVKDIGEGTGALHKAAPPPALGYSQTPQDYAAKQAAQRAAAARQSQIDTQTQTPGRGGTILTDNYRYNT